MTMVLFDCDGVLVNSEELVEQALRDTYAGYGVDFTLKEIRAKFIGHTHQEYLRRRAEEFRIATGADLPEDFALKLEFNFRARATDNLRAINGIHAMLTDLKARNIPFAVASNSGIEHLKVKLKQTGLYDFFHPHIYSRDHVKEGKPAPDVYLHAMNKLGGSPDQCIVVEDSAPGVRAGVAAGMHVIGFARIDQVMPGDPAPLLKAGAKETVATGAELHQRILALAGQSPTPRPSPQPPHLSP